MSSNVRKSDLAALTLLVAVTLSSSLFATEHASARELEIGQPFPELWLPALTNGAPTSTKQWRGQKVILHVFASW